MDQLDIVWAAILLVPDFIWHLAVILGITGLLLSSLIRFIPLIGFYKFLIQVISFILLLVGTYMEGGMSCRNAGKEQNTNFRKAEENAKDINKKLDSEINNNINNASANTENQVQYVDRIQTVIKTVPGPKVVETLVKDMSPEERAKYEAKSKDEKDKYEKQILELQQSLQNCPIPTLVIEEMNKAAKGDKK